MMTKSSPRLARGGTPVLAFLTGVGAATVIAGAVRGTLFPQIGASINLLNIETTQPDLNELVGWFVNGLVILVGTVTTLIYFQFSTRRQEESVPAQRPVILEYLSTAGQVFIVITLGVLFAGAYIAALSALIDRVQFIWETIARIF
jgi:heme/copper-type cytochrome/quinol oxidase subunit 2